MLFVNTRPIERAQPLTAYLQQSGFEVVDLPLLALKPRPFTNALQQLYQQLIDTQMIVVVSPTAVEIGMQYLQQAGISPIQLQHIQWIAVGKKTAEVLKAFGFQSHVPEVETSEGMLSLPIFKQLEHIQKIAFWRGEGGRQFMMEQCYARHIDVLNFVLYERFCPPEAKAQLSALVPKLKDAEIPYWSCVTSEASWQNWLALTQDHPEIVDQGHYLVLGERLYQLLSQKQQASQKYFNITQILNLQPETILRTIQQLQRTL